MAWTLPTLKHPYRAAARCVTRTASFIVLADPTFQIIGDTAVKSAVAATNNVERPRRGLRFELMRHSSMKETENVPNFHRGRG